MRTSLLTLLFLATTACSWSQRATVGAAIGGAGLATTYLAVQSMVPGCRQDSGRDRVCVEDYKTTPPEVGFPIAFGGLGVAVLGGLIVGAGAENRPVSPPHADDTPAHSEEPSRLFASDAVGMVVARLMIVGIEHDKPRELQNVDSSQITLNVEGRHAELWNLRVHTVDGTGLTLGACYEYDGEWRMTALGTSPCVR
ncbi:MAG TPA: hypothetical protein VHB79_31800 [Polyangiaceae bacterium]|nr:hypothetical protein [Polyangiaceae bacterium]